MKPRNFRFILGLVLVVMNYGAHAETGEVLSRYFVNPPTDEIMQKIADRFEVVKKVQNGYQILVPIEKTSELKTIFKDAVLLSKDISAEIDQSVLQETQGTAKYHTYEEVVSILQNLANQNSSFVKLEQYGSDSSGRALYVLKISDNVEQDEDEPELMITSATHGDEIITVEVVLGIIDNLVTKAKTEERFTNMVNNHELFFIPMVNADGFVRRSRYANGVDPNRNYPWPEQPERQSIGCIAEIIKFFEIHDIKGSIDFHASGRLVMYPWAYTYDSLPSEDASIFEVLAQNMAKENHYHFGQISDIMYIAKGSSADYYYWKNNTIAFGIEIATSMAPPVSQIESEINDNLELTWQFIEYFNNKYPEVSLSGG